MKYTDIKHIARNLRKNQTLSERKIWHRIRRRQLKGRKFLRQHVIVYESTNDDHFFFIPDFYCAGERLIIEVDGRIHDFQKERDLKRDEILKYMGLKVLRIKEEELDDMESVLRRIEKMFDD